MQILWAILLILASLGSWVLTLLSMPGNWVIVALAALYAWLLPYEDGSFGHLGWTAVIALLILASLGELLELLAAALGASRGGGSKRAAVLAVIGSVIGSLVGATVSVPIAPSVIGPVIGVVLGAGLGAMAGAMLGEIWKGRTTGESWRIGKSAFWGRMLGTAAKLVVATAMIGTVIVGLIF